ncbi:B-cell receptor CD22 [Nibea albiflora]|uniref:B-cell receptor CD22 n=1 Tax=Nibea albiflora TaxID=240163 RepID=A0ACB7F7U7_NIBAL|nr:B-cell receptor CD22 [Nibea albiflora]
MLAGALVLGTILTALPGHTVRRVMWFRVSADGRREFTHHTDPNQISLSYRGRTRYIGGSYSSCSVQIRVVKLSDAGDYHFRFETDQPLGRWTSPNTIRLDVTDLQVQVHPARPGNMFGFGETVFVGCQARGCAAPGRSLALYRNGLNLGSHEKWMIINRFDQQHAGAYTCRPIPPQNVQSPSLSLALGHGPHSTSISVFPVGEVAEGGSVTLTCTSDGAPPVESFAWFKDMDSGSIPDSFRPQLHLSHLKYTDRGEYFCVARNSLGTDRSKPLLLNVTYSPKNTRVLVTPPGDIREGSYVNLSCVSHAHPPASRYAWYRILGDQVLAKGTIQNLTFPVVRAHHAGQYYCTAWNRLGYQTSLVTTLSILYPPKNTSVLARPSSVVDAGRPLTLTCSSQANPAVDNFTWHRLTLDGGSVQSWGTKSGPVFTFSEVGPGESGQYYCEARNRIGAHSSPVLTVRVRVKLIAFIVLPLAGRLKVIALASAVGVSAALITLTVAIMIRVDHCGTAEHCDRRRKCPSELYDGLYNTCKHCLVQRRTNYAPDKVTLSMSPSGEAVKGSSVTFKCSSDANPPVTQSGYSLYKDGHVISSGQNHTISDIQPSHSGLYYCQAGNKISRRGIDFINSTEINLNVQYYPVNISISMKPSLVVGGSSMNLTCSSAANPPANYTWYKRTDSLSSTVQQPHIELNGRAPSSSGTEDQPNTVYANIHALPSSPPADISAPAQKSSHPEYDAPTAHEDEVTYSTVTITPKKPSRSHHINRTALQDSQ